MLSGYLEILAEQKLFSTKQGATLYEATGNVKLAQEKQTGRDGKAFTGYQVQ